MIESDKVSVFGALTYGSSLGNPLATHISESAVTVDPESADSLGRGGAEILGWL